MEKNHEQTIMADEAKVIEYAKSYDWDDVRFLAKELGKKDLKIEKLNNQLDDFYRNKAENRKLKEIIQKQGDQLIVFKAKEEKPHNASSACAHAVLGVKNSEIDELKKENKKLQEELDNEVSAEGLDLVQIKYLTEENKKLKEKIFDLENTDSKIADERLDEIIKLECRVKELEDEKPYEELYNLQHENEKLKEEVNTEIKTIGEWVKLRDTALDRISELHEEIDELKAKNKELKSHLDGELLAEVKSLRTHHNWWLKEGGMKKYQALDCEVSQLRVQLEEDKHQEPYEYEVRNPEGKTRYLGRDFEEAKKHSEQMEDNGVPLHPPIMVYYVCPEEDEACYDNWFYIRTYETNPDGD